MIPFQTGADVNGHAIPEIPFSDHVDVAVLTAGVAQSFTVPDGANVVLFSSNVDFLLKSGSSVGWPSSSSSAGNAGEMNPSVRSVVAGNTFSLVSNVSGVVTMSYFSK